MNGLLSACKLRPALMTMLAIVAGVCSGSPGTAYAGNLPQVIFDVSPMIECRDVTPEGFAQVNPNEKIIEATFRVSILLRDGEEDDTSELMITLVSPEKRLRVVDFTPKARTVSEVDGTIERVETREVEKSITASIGGAFSGEYGVARVQASPAAGAGNISRNVATEKYKRHPAQQRVLVSGTMHDEYGVFFKLKPSVHASLEGMQEFTCQYAVPAGWRGDWAQVTCHARGFVKNYFGGQTKELGRKEALIGLYLGGDIEAKQIAERFARLEGIEFTPSLPADGNRTDGLRTAFKPATQGGANACTSLRQLATLASSFPWPGKTPEEHGASTGSKPSNARQHRTQNPLPGPLDALEKLSGFSRVPLVP